MADMISPNAWVVIKIGQDKPLCKVFATWYGGYLVGDSWKMNSGIVKVEKEGKYFNFYGVSGSCYQCHEVAYGTNSYSQGVLDKIIEMSQTLDEDRQAEVLPLDTDWLKLL